MRVLVTGASGLLGLTTALEARENHRVCGVVNRHPLQARGIEDLKVDLREHHAVEALFENVEPEWVIHCAALADVGLCEENPALAQRLNAEVPGEIAWAAKRIGARLLHVSTDAVFGGENGNYREEDIPHPIHTYGKTKLAGERIVREVYPEALIARVNMFGWSPSGDRSLAEFFYHHLRRGERVQGFTDVVFNPLLVNDLARILLQVLENELEGLYHIGGPDSWSKYQFGVGIAESFDFDPDLIEPSSIDQAGLKPARGKRLNLCVEKLIHSLGLELPGLSTALERFYTLYQQGYPQKIREMVDYS